VKIDFSQVRSNGTPNQGRFWNTRQFIQENGEWRCAAWQVMRISDT